MFHLGFKLDQRVRDRLGRCSGFSSLPEARGNTAAFSFLSSVFTHVTNDQAAPLNPAQKWLYNQQTASDDVTQQVTSSSRSPSANAFVFPAPEELRAIIQEAKYRSGLQSAKLIRQLRRRDRLSHKLQKNCDIITACLQAVSQKRSKNSCLALITDHSC